MGVDVEHGLYHLPKVVGVSLGNSLKLPFNDPFEEPLHVISCKGGFEGNHFIDDTPEGPDVTFDVVRLVSPDFRTCVIGGTSLGVVEAFLVGYFGDIHVAELDLPVLIEKDVCALQVSVHNLKVVHGFQPPYDLDQNLPYLLLLKLPLLILLVRDLLEQVPKVCELHHYAKP